MNNYSVKNAFKTKKREITSIITLAIISLIVSAPLMVFSASAIGSEPSLEEILNNLGYTNIQVVDTETFPAGSYEVTMLAEFAGYYNINTLSYYIVGTNESQLIFAGSEGSTVSPNGGYVTPSISKMIEVDAQFGMLMCSPEHQYFTEHYLNQDFPKQHVQVYVNLDNPNMVFIGFENYFGEDIDRDYNDIVFSLTLITPVEDDPVEIASVTRAPGTPNFDESVTVTANVIKGSYDVSSVILSYQIGSGSWNNVTMNLINTNYVADIAAQQYGTTVNYQVYTCDTNGNIDVSSVYSYTVGDFVAPAISDVKKAPTTVSPNELVTISATVVDQTAGSGVNNVKLRYKLATDWISTNMHLVNGVWTGNIPGQEQGTDVQFYVEAFDNAGNNDKTAVFSYRTIIPNSGPIAHFTASPAPGYVNENIDFDGSASYDPEGLIVSYSWDFGDETYAQGATASHAYTESGEYLVKFTVTDNMGASTTVIQSITIQNRPPQEVNNAPTAAFTAAPETAEFEEKIIFNAVDSYDSDGTIVSYVWDFGDGTTATGIKTSHTYANSGSYTVKLTVTDNYGATDSTTEKVTVKDAPENIPPVAVIAETAESINTNEDIMLDASESYDTDGTIVSYSWDFGDETTATGAVETHVYADNGEYTVTLTVTDNKGATDSTSTTITILNQAPVAAFNENTTAIMENEAISFDASESYDTDGTIVSYSWDFGDGTTATGTTTEHTYTEEGSYTVTLTVTDDDGAYSTAVTEITVETEPTVELAVLSVIGLGITALTATLLYGLFIRRKKKKDEESD